MTAPDTNDLDDLEAASDAAFTRAFDGVLEVVVIDSGVFWVDGRTAPPKIHKALPEDVSEADCRWRGSFDAIKRALDGERGLENLYASGRIAISGDMALMARLKLESSV
ncbi:MAG: SCP2 sterol-binding domain-containing protein [Pseudomonadota bacterium]